MVAGTIAPTVPFCRACGWNIDTELGGQFPDLAADDICDSCGDSLLESGFGLVLPPADLAAVAGVLVVTFTWTEVVGTTYEFQHQTDGGAFTLVSPATSPQAIAGVTGEVIGGQVRSCVNGVCGPWSTLVSDTVPV